MGVPCPKCGANIEQDFGLVNCPQCGTVVSIDVDGNVQVVEAQVYTESSQEISVESSEVPAETATPIYSVNTDFQPYDTPEKIPVLSATEEIANYGNTETSAGPLTYTITIEGIDLADTRNLVLEALTNSKFDWEKTEIENRIKSGKLELEALTPAQAVMVIRRLQGVGVQLSWRQYVYS